jgi:predicted CopG family antitoxin
MKRKITLSIDSDVYDELDNLPRKVSISEVVNWVLKAMLQDVKAGREISSEELREYARKSKEGNDFLERYDEHVAPKINKILDELDNIKSAIGKNKKK